MQAWKKLRKWLHRRHGQVRFFRVLEPHKTGGVHIHVVIEKCLPEVFKPAHRESIRSYYSRQTDEGKSLIDRVVRFGFGPIMHVRLCYGGPAGIAAYLGKYLTKAQAKTLSRTHGRRLRVAEGSRNWLREGRVDEYRYGVSRRADHEVAERDCDCCDSGNRPIDVAEAREARRRFWISQMGDFDMAKVDAADKLVAKAASELQKVMDDDSLTWEQKDRVRTRVDGVRTWRRQLIDAERAAHTYEGPIGVFLRERRKTT